MNLKTDSRGRGMAHLVSISQSMLTHMKKFIMAADTYKPQCWGGGDKSFQQVSWCLSS